MKLQSAKVLVIVMTLAGAAALAGLLFFLFLPTLRDVRDLKRQIVEAHTELEAQYTNRKNLLSSRAKVAETRELMKTLATQFVPVGRELDFITGVEALAAKNGVTERLQLSKNTDARKAPELEHRFDLSFSGTFRASLQMLTDLEKMPALIIIDSMTVRPGASLEGAPSLTIDLHGTVAVPPAGLL